MFLLEALGQTPAPGTSSPLPAPGGHRHFWLCAPPPPTTAALCPMFLPPHLFLCLGPSYLPFIRTLGPPRCARILFPPQSPTSSTKSILPDPQALKLQTGHYGAIILPACRTSAGQRDTQEAMATVTLGSGMVCALEGMMEVGCSDSGCFEWPCLSVLHSS